MQDSRHIPVLRDVAAYADGVKLGVAVISHAIETRDKDFFTSKDFFFWLNMMGMTESDFRVKGLLEQVSTMPKHIHKPLTIGQRLQRVRDDER
jgi:hypothetical protein